MEHETTVTEEREGAGSRRRRRRRRVPLVRQQTATDCAAACLAMVLAYHGRRTPLAVCRQRVGSGRDGTTARALIGAAASSGLRMTAYAADGADLTDVALPAVVHWELDHYVVVERWTRRQVAVVDPAAGRRTLTPEEFSRGFTGVVLTAEPAADFAPGEDGSPVTWRTYLAYLFRSAAVRGLAVQVIVAALLLELLGLAVPLITKYLLDTVVPLHLDGFMPVIALGIAALAATQLVTGYLRGALLINLQARMDWQMMADFFEHLLRVPYRSFHQRGSGDLVMRLMSNTLLRNVLGNQAVIALLTGALSLLYAAVLLAVSPPFGVVVLLLAAVQLCLLAGTAGAMHRRTRENLADQADAQDFATEAIRGIATVKAGGGEVRARSHWEHILARYLASSLRRAQLASLVGAASDTLRTFSPAILLWAATGAVLTGDMSVGTMFAVTMLGSTFLDAVASMVATGQQLPMVGGVLERVVDVVTIEPERVGGRRPAAVRGDVDLHDVTVTYEGACRPALDGVTLAVRPGEHVAVVGASGCGKSTLLHLLLGLLEADRGQLTMDGVGADELDWAAYRDHVGVVLQDAFVFDGTVRDVVSGNDAAMPLDEVVRATALACLHEEVQRMPLGYDTPVGEGGASLSGGQRQRLALARALARSPRLLVLDEATSHLDTETEARVMANLRSLRCTTVLVAHRLSTIRAVDRIVVLHDGRIDEEGPHTELMAAGGRYARLVDRQLDGAVPVGAGAVH